MEEIVLAAYICRDLPLCCAVCLLPVSCDLSCSLFCDRFAVCSLPTPPSVSPAAGLASRCHSQPLLRASSVQFARMAEADGGAVTLVSSNGVLPHLHYHRRRQDAEPSIRVGSLYQAVLPPFAPPVSPPPRPLARPVDDNDAAAAEARFGVVEVQAEDDSGGQALWLASRIKQSRTRQQHSIRLSAHQCIHGSCVMCRQTQPVSSVQLLALPAVLCARLPVVLCSGQLLAVRPNSVPQESSQPSHSHSSSSPHMLFLPPAISRSSSSALTDT